MNERTEREEQSYCRRITVSAYGDTKEELELFALDEARAFFGADARLDIVRDYHVHAYDNTDINHGKRYHANVTVAEPAP